MSNSIFAEIPYEWFKKPHYFFTYFGEVYHGYAVLCTDEESIFYIVSNNFLRQLKSSNKTKEELDKLGWRITNKNVIKQAIIDEGDLGGRNIKNDYDGTRKRIKKMFVLGAAASSYCLYSDEAFSESIANLNRFNNSVYRPPLGNLIFDKKYDKFISHFPGVINSRGVIHENIEEFLNDQWDKYKDHYHPEISINHINIQYYLQHVLSVQSEHITKYFKEFNLYQIFLEKLKRYYEKDRDKNMVSITNFNYDTILEGFTQDVFGFSYSKMKDYVDFEKSPFILIKPHGSSNWGWRFQDERLEGMNLKKSGQFLFENNIEPWRVYYELIDKPQKTIEEGSWGFEMGEDEHRRGRFRINKDLIEFIDPNKPFFPALLMPYRDKDEFVMPYQHLKDLRSILGDIEELYLIGWKGNEHLFNKKLKKHARSLKSIVVVNPEIKEVLENISKYISLEGIDVKHVKYFEDFVLKDLDDYLN